MVGSVLSSYQQKKQLKEHQTSLSSLNVLFSFGEFISCLFQNSRVCAVCDLDPILQLCFAHSYEILDKTEFPLDKIDIALTSICLRCNTAQQMKSGFHAIKEPGLVSVESICEIFHVIEYHCRQGLGAHSRNKVAPKSERNLEGGWLAEKYYVNRFCVPETDAFNYIE